MVTEKLNKKQLIKNLQVVVTENIRITLNENLNTEQILIFAGRLAYKELTLNKEIKDE